MSIIPQLSSSDFVTLIGHLAWPTTIVGVCIFARRQITEVLNSIAKRVADGSSEVSITKDGISIKGIDKAVPGASGVKALEQSVPSNLDEVKTIGSEQPNYSFEVERSRIKRECHDFFLVHVLEPTTQNGQMFDIFIYVMGHRNKDVSVISKAQFFFGKYWHNKVFDGERLGNVIGVRTAAYGSFLCVCRLTFTDGSQVTLSRYIDFEMGKLISPSQT